MEKIQVSDFAFVNELVNTEGWLAFIGDRNVHSDEQAKTYISKTLENNNIQYWVARVKPDLLPAGIVSLVRRDYLPCRDIGFAFLPRFMKMGFAYEAVNALLHVLQPCNNSDTILAITSKANTPSIRLLEKLKFMYQKDIEHEGKFIQVYEKALHEKARSGGN